MLRTRFLHIWMAYQKLFAFRFFFSPASLAAFFSFVCVRVFFLFLFSLSLPRFVCRAHGRTFFPYITNNIWYFKKDVPFFRACVVVAFFFLALRNNWCLFENILRYNISCVCFFFIILHAAAASLCISYELKLSHIISIRVFCFCASLSLALLSAFSPFRRISIWPIRFPFAIFAWCLAEKQSDVWKKERTQWAHYLKYSILFP